MLDSARFRLICEKYTARQGPVTKLWLSNAANKVQSQNTANNLQMGGLGGGCGVPGTWL